MDSIDQKIRLDNIKELMYVLIQIIALLYTLNCIKEYNKWNTD
jgi:hypothetical protein